MRTVLILPALFLLAAATDPLTTPVQAEEDFCARIAERLDAMPDRETKEYKAHQSFFFWECLVRACSRSKAGTIYYQSKDYRTAWEAVNAGCFPF